MIEIILEGKNIHDYLNLSFVRMIINADKSPMFGVKSRNGFVFLKEGDIIRYNDASDAACEYKINR